MGDGGFEHEEAPEPVEDLLVLGVLFLPALFVWFLLRRRYAPEIRIGAAPPGFAWSPSRDKLGEEFPLC